MVFFFFWQRLNQKAKLYCPRFWSISIIHLKWLFPLVITMSLCKKHVLFLDSNFCRVLNVVRFLVGNSPPSEFYVPTSKKRQSLPKRWHIKFRLWGITQKKAYRYVLLLNSVACILRRVSVLVWTALKAQHIHILQRRSWDLAQLIHRTLRVLYIYNFVRCKLKNIYEPTFRALST